MNYRAIGDLSFLVNEQVGSIPHDVDLIVGIPRSGMLVASILSLKLNLPLTDLYSFKRNDPLKKGNTRVYKNDQLAHPHEAKKILLVDDSIASGNSMREAVTLVKETFDGEILTMVAFAEKSNLDQVDIHLEAVEQPRVFEWNILHHSVINYACVDLDGVLCAPHGSTQLQASDCVGAKPLFIPSAEIAHLVTTRPARYRAETEAWLQEHGVRYGQLHMFEEPNPPQQQGTAWKAAFKAQVYRNDPHSVLYVERRADHAREIMRLSNKPVFCLATNEMLNPGSSLLALKEQLVRKSLTFREKMISRLRAYKHSHWDPLLERK